MTWLDLTLIAAASLAFVYFGYQGVRRWRAGRRRRMTEILSSARDELASERLDARLMAVFSLEETAKESDSGYREAAEILTAFLRRSRCRCARDGSGPSPGPVGRGPALAPDVQRALTVLARCRPAADGTSDASGTRLDLSRAGLCRAGLPAARLSGVRLRGACFAGAELWKVELRGADLSGARLARANLSGADLDGATLAGANLSGANLEYATARSASFSGADLTRVDLTFAHLEAADLSDVTGLTGAQIESAYTDPQTKLPVGFA